MAQALYDDAVLEPRERITQSWTVKNTGDLAWESGWVFTPLTEESHATGSREIPLTARISPGDTVRLAVEFLVPDEGVDVAEAWSLRAHAGGAVLVELPFHYDVATTLSGTVRWVAPAIREIWIPETAGRFRIQIANDTERGWGVGFKLVKELGVGSRDWVVPFPAIVYPHQTREIDIPVISPGVVGVYRERWHLESPQGQVVPVNGAAAFEFGMSVAGRGRILVVDETLADGTVVAPGSAFAKTFRLRKLDNDTWGEGARLRHVDGDLALADEVLVPGAWQPGEERVVVVPLRAPSTGVVEGAVLLDRWELVADSGVVVAVVDQDPNGLTDILRPLNGPGWLWASVVVQAPCTPAD